jgi:hypothetical protein
MPGFSHSQARVGFDTHQREKSWPTRGMQEAMSVRNIQIAQARYNLRASSISGNKTPFPACNVCFSMNSRSGSTLSPIMTHNPKTVTTSL